MGKKNLQNDNLERGTALHFNFPGSLLHLNFAYVRKPWINGTACPQYLEGAQEYTSILMLPLQKNIVLLIGL